MALSPRQCCEFTSVDGYFTGSFSTEGVNISKTVSITEGVYTYEMTGTDGVGVLSPSSYSVRYRFPATRTEGLDR